MRLGSLVLGATYRHPAVLANWAATVDHASGGRLVLGIGAGWQENEHEQYGLRLGSPGERIARFDEELQVIRGLLTEPTTTVHGEHYELRRHQRAQARAGTAPASSSGGKGDRMLGVVARHADEWNMWSRPTSSPSAPRCSARRCEAIGRDPATIPRSTQTLVFLTDDEARAADRRGPGGAPPAVAGDAARSPSGAAWAAVGVDEMIVPDFTLGTGAQRLDALDVLVEAFVPIRRTRP